MAYNNSSAFFLIALILFTATNPLAHGTFLGGISASGSLCCTSTGNCPGGPGVPGVLVRLDCSRLLGASVTVGQNITDVNGFFNITVPNLTGSLFTRPILPCYVVIQLPLNQTICPALSTVNGALVGSLLPVGSVLSQLFVLIRTFTVAFFIRI